MTTVDVCLCVSGRGGARSPAGGLERTFSLLVQNRVKSQLGISKVCHP